MTNTELRLKQIDEKAASCPGAVVAMAHLAAVLTGMAVEEDLPSGATIGAVCTWTNKGGGMHRGFIVGEEEHGHLGKHYRILFDPEHENCPAILTIALPVGSFNYEHRMQRLSEIAPARFLVTAEGKAISYRQWESRGDAFPIVVWVRNDGWTLAAPVGLDIIARNLWQKDWVGVWNYGAGDCYFYHDLTGDNKLADWSDGTKLE